MFGSSAGTGFQAQKPGGFLFGSQNNNNNNTNTNNTAAPASGFGTTPSSGFSLGNSNANAGGFGAKPAGATGGLFGGPSAPAANTASGGLFGGNSANSGAAAGGSGGLFGSNNAGANTGAPGATGGLFGNNPASTGTNAGTSGGLFGNNAANPTNAGTSGGLFGGSTANANTNTTTNTGTSGGLFGSSTTGTNPAGSAGSSLFGSNPANTGSTGTSLFGKPNGALGGTTGTPGTGGGGLFGNSQPAPATGGLFGKPAAPSTGGLFGGSTTSNGGLFGQQQQQQQQQNTQVQPPQNTLNNAQPSFSWSSQPQAAGPSNSLSSLEIRLPAAPKAPQTASYTPAVNDQLARLQAQWDPRSPKCALNTHLYNKFSEQEIAVLMQQPRPATETPEDWERAMAQRPSPLHYPVKVSSFSEMAQRIEVQLDHVGKSRVFLNNLYEKQTQLSAQRELDTATRILRAKVRHTKLSRRLLKVATLLAVLKMKGYPLLPEEEEISKQFQVLNARLSDPAGPVGKLSDLYARLAILRGRSEDLSAQLETSLSAMNGGLDSLAHGSVESGDAAAQTEQVIKQLTQLLYKQQMGLGFVNDVVQEDLAKVNALVKK